jgi:hypothetical protein
MGALGVKAQRDGLRNAIRSLAGNRLRIGDNDAELCWCPKARATPFTESQFHSGQCVAAHDALCKATP